MNLRRFLKLCGFACVFWLPVAIPYALLAYTDTSLWVAQFIIWILLGACYVVPLWRSLKSHPKRARRSTLSSEDTREI